MKSIVYLFITTTYFIIVNCNSQYKSFLSKNSNSTYFNYSLVLDLNSNTDLTSWLSISSESFKDRSPIKLPSGNFEYFKYDSFNRRLNQITNNVIFFFQFKAGYIYYSNNDKDSNILDSIYVKHIANSDNVLCFDVWDYSDFKYNICSNDKLYKLRWLCTLQNYFNYQSLDKQCMTSDNNNDILIKYTTQPIIIIPESSPLCNEIWDYKQMGTDWQCLCKEGQNQSPIDLPSFENAILSPSKPIFAYNKVDVNKLKKQKVDVFDEIYIPSKNINLEEDLYQGRPHLRYEDGSIKLHAKNLGKILTIDDYTYNAEKIIFHTPSEHTIEGRRFDMEMQIIHNGESQGVIGKYITLSFLFKAMPGKYNKFFDSIDTYLLPNQFENKKELVNNIFIPYVLFDSDEIDKEVVKPFSFYSYDGSITYPPCSESTKVFVVADPIGLSMTTINMFREALRRPDKFINDRLITDNKIYDNNRSTQRLNNRLIYFYDHIRYEAPIFINSKPLKEEDYHYEKKKIIKSKYLRIQGKTPSNIPGSYLVNKEEISKENPYINLE